MPELKVTEIIHVTLVGVDGETGECYVDASSDSTEGTERVWSYLPEEED